MGWGGGRGTGSSQIKLNLLVIRCNLLPTDVRSYDSVAAPTCERITGTVLSHPSLSPPLSLLLRCAINLAPSVSEGSPKEKDSELSDKICGPNSGVCVSRLHVLIGYSWSVAQISATRSL